ncbi:hypothetical protein B0H94_110124 [Salsuginibacillus halophilus]|uniref:Uncharacterized protein n=1 Tax=Salsuginibacillus halophilus TaxID=517424 RepID=A0A2P8HBQ0_9BACI|nr:hypothetical protein [Salsuginibacillus halophilus]PSL43648.1 hypothetical protein B0H94_110124 [Salsuginibacillus halophilus]
MSTEAKSYFVNLHPTSMDEISTTYIDDPELIQYEIKATPDQLEKIKHLVSETHAHDMEAQNLFTFRHFDEHIEENDRYEFERGFEHVLHAIYDLGTPDTKAKIEEMHWFDKPH